MRARLALLMAAVVVFAPASPGFEPSGERPRGSVAARMLAPTFDEGMLQRTPGPDELARAWEGQRPRPLLTAFGRHGRPLLGLAAEALVWLVALSLPEFLGLLRAHAGSPRGPPRLQLV
jgi:hypothetical protein